METYLLIAAPVPPPAGADRDEVGATLDSTVAAGATLQISAADGTEVATASTLKATQSVAFSSSAIVNGETYSIVVDGEVVGAATAGEQATSSMGGPGGGRG